MKWYSFLPDFTRSIFFRALAVPQTMATLTVMPLMSACCLQVRRPGQAFGLPNHYTISKFKPQPPEILYFQGFLELSIP